MWNGPARRRRAFTLATCPEPVDYRREIDGLRALAVVPVILFHAGFQAFSGGFVGVDVFFVVSGYLITTVIIEDLARGAFSIATFYERRARRILPALFFVIVPELGPVVGWLLREKPECSKRGSDSNSATTRSASRPGGRCP